MKLNATDSISFFQLVPGREPGARTLKANPQTWLISSCSVAQYEVLEGSQQDIARHKDARSIV